MFSWDAANIEHIKRHNIRPEEVEELLENNPLDLGKQIRDGEARRLHLGATSAKRILFVVVTVRNQTIRVVTAYPADRKSRKFYEQQKKQRDKAAAGGS